MAANDPGAELRKKNFRLCKIQLWPETTGAGFNLEATPKPPFSILAIESNSPAAAARLRISDIILQVNGKDAMKMTFSELGETVKKSLANDKSITLLVIEKQHYDVFVAQKVKFDPKYAEKIDGPARMPSEYKNFPKDKPRTCNIQRNPGETSFGFEIVAGPKDMGGYIQHVVPGGPGERASLRKCDRIIEINDELVAEQPYARIRDLLVQNKTSPSIKLYVMDTVTYKKYTSEKIPLRAAADNPASGN